MPTKSTPDKNAKSKIEQLERDREHPEGTYLTTDQGIRVAHTDDSLKAGVRGGTLLQDFHLREKMTRFDHERIPERVVHARGSAAHGVFQCYEPLGDITSAGFLSDPKRKTPVFVRFSTVGGSRGSTDLARDVRGFAVKFYTEEGNFDLVGNNMPVFFIQDGIKFPDFVHAVKPEPHHEMPQAASAHDSFWDFVSLQPETAHMVMWLMSDRALPRSYRMMEGFGVHTFRLVNARGKTRLVKFHWKPLLGMHSVVWDEAQKISGKDPDFHRRDLWEAIEARAFPEWELGVQVMKEEDATRFGFDLLDPTKLVPEELVPVRKIGKMTLDRNPDNFFAETEQVAFCVANLVPGIEVTEDPLMQARLFSYLDTQLTRLGGPNFAEIPINRPLAPVHNHQQDGFHRQTIPTGRANYFPNSLGGGCPMAALRQGGYMEVPLLFPEGTRRSRERSESFGDHFSQATLFLNSLSAPERAHLVNALRFELGKVERKEIREKVVKDILRSIDDGLATEVGETLGIGIRPPPAPRGSASQVKADAKRAATGAANGKGRGKAAVSPALSMASTPKGDIRTRQVAVLAASGVSGADVQELKSALEGKGAMIHVVSVVLGPVEAEGGKGIVADRSFLTASSVLFDAVYVPGGARSAQALKSSPDALSFLNEAFRHCKTLGATGEGVEVVSAAIGRDLEGQKPPALQEAMAGVILSNEGKTAAFTKVFIAAMGEHRHWSREGVVPSRA